MLKTWLAVKKSKSGLLFDDASVPTLSRGYIASKLKDVLVHLGLNYTSYSTHSFRIGKTSDMATHGASSEQIRLFGRWKSQAYTTYTKPKFVVAGWWFVILVSLYLFVYIYIYIPCVFLHFLPHLRWLAVYFWQENCLLLIYSLNHILKYICTII